jgi:hypothetical protein
MKPIDISTRFEKLRRRRTSRKEKRLNKKGKSERKKILSFLKYIIFLIFLLSIYLVLSSKTKFWNTTGKLSVVINSSNNEISIVTFDAKRMEISQIIIPSDTQVEVARGMGSWKIKSIWKLGEEEGLGGLLMAETLTHQMKMPVYVWVDAPGEGFISKNIFKILKTLFYPFRTNMGLGDKIRIVLFNISVKNSDRKIINLAETSYLKQGELTDGGSGYLITGKYPSELLAIFSDEEISQKSLKVAINDYSGNSVVANNLGEVIEILGAKVASINNEEKLSMDCEVGGNNLLVEKIVALFNCRKTGGGEGVFDVSLKIGESFAKRF